MDCLRDSDAGMMILISLPEAENRLTDGLMCFTLKGKRVTPRIWPLGATLALQDNLSYPKRL